MSPNSVGLPVSIVMIEDDEGHATLIERNIRRAGVNNPIVPFTSGTAALQFLLGKDGTGMVHAGNALLVLLDLNLPDMTGIEILTTIKANPHLKRSPVVVLTTTDDQREILAVLRSGCQRLYYKARRLREFRQRHSPAGTIFRRDAGADNRVAMTQQIRILYIDDDAGLGVLLRKALPPPDFLVEAVETGDEAIARLGQTEYDVVALDHNLINEVGLDLIPRIGAVACASNHLCDGIRGCAHRSGRTQGRRRGLRLERRAGPLPGAASGSHRFGHRAGAPQAAPDDSKATGRGGARSRRGY